MSLFKKQPAYCSMCGLKDDYEFDRTRPIICSEDCWEEFNWRYTLHVMGKDYYPKPKKEND
jgi:hypothetical protein